MRCAGRWSRGSSTVVCSSIMCPSWCELKLKLVCAWLKVGKLEVSTLCFPRFLLIYLFLGSNKKRIAHVSFLVHACQQNLFFCSIMLYKLYKIMFLSSLMERFCLFDWILKAKLYQIPQDNFVHFEGALTVATKNTMQHRFSFFFYRKQLKRAKKQEKKERDRNNFIFPWSVRMQSRTFSPVNVYQS